jgi:hypothetical protein
VVVPIAAIDLVVAGAAVEMVVVVATPDLVVAAAAVDGVVAAALQHVAVKGERDGKGTFTGAGGFVYEGHWQNGQPWP